MGKLTMEITHGELVTLIAKGFEAMGLDKKMGGFDDKTLFSVYKAYQGASKFTVTVEGESINGNEEKWQAKMRKQNWEQWKYFMVLVSSIIGVFAAMVVAAHFGFFEWFPTIVVKGITYISSLIG